MSALMMGKKKGKPPADRAGGEDGQTSVRLADVDLRKLRALAGYRDETLAETFHYVAAKFIDSELRKHTPPEPDPNDEAA